MTEQQTAADNALVEKLVSKGTIGSDMGPVEWLRNPDGPEAAERIKSLLAEVRALEHHRSMTADCIAVLLTKKDEAEAEIAALTRSFTDVSKQYLKALDEVAASKADRQRMRDALEAIYVLGSDGEHSGDRHARCRDIARQALNHASKEANDEPEL